MRFFNFDKFYENSALENSEILKMLARKVGKGRVLAFRDSVFSSFIKILSSGFIFLFFKLTTFALTMGGTYFGIFLIY